MKVENINISHLQAFSEPKAIEEDPEAQREVFEDKDISAYISEFNPYNIENDHDITNEVIQIHEQLETANVYIPPIHRSYKSLSLAEALVLIELIHNPIDSFDYAQLKLNSNQKFTSNSIRSTLSFHSKDHKKLKAFTLEYDSSVFRVLIMDNEKVLGSVKYHLRGKKCEEIIGDFRGQKLILDPVWHPRKKGVLKHIILEFAKIKTTLIFYSNSKETIGKSGALNVKNKSIKKTSTKALVKKELAISRHKIKMQLLYDKHILLPILGLWRITSSN